MDTLNLRTKLSEEQVELLWALDRLFLKRSQWTTQKNYPSGVADIADEFVRHQRYTRLAEVPSKGTTITRQAS